MSICGLTVSVQPRVTQMCLVETLRPTTDTRYPSVKTFPFVIPQEVIDAMRKRECAAGIFAAATRIAASKGCAHMHA